MSTGNMSGEEESRSVLEVAARQSKADGAYLHRILRSKISRAPLIRNVMTFPDALIVLAMRLRVLLHSGFEVARV
eukprot:scaffold2857_cov344-Pavlova_lutheri.AAC.9